MDDLINIIIASGTTAILIAILTIIINIAIIVGFFGICNNIRKINYKQEDIEEQIERYLASIESFMRVQNKQNDLTNELLKSLIEKQFKNNEIIEFNEIKEKSLVE